MWSHSIGVYWEIRKIIPVTPSYLEFFKIQPLQPKFSSCMCFYMTYVLERLELESIHSLFVCVLCQSLFLIYCLEEIELSNSSL